MGMGYGNLIEHQIIQEEIHRSGVNSSSDISPVNRKIGNLVVNENK